MRKAIIYGLGQVYRRYIGYLKTKYIIVGETDREEWKGKRLGSKYIPPTKLKDEEADVIIICSYTYEDEIRKYIKEELKIEKIQIIGLDEACCDITRKKCSCCEKRVLYLPLPDEYVIMQNKYRYGSYPELLNKEEYICPNCKITDRGRLIIEFLKVSGMQNEKSVSIIQFGPEKPLEDWIKKLPNVKYDSADLYQENVSIRTDIQNMNTIGDNTYDYFICSHVLEHVKDDRKAMKELYRILKQDGVGIFLVPIGRNRVDIDEEWGLSEEENWRRFGQGDHCRAYDRRHLIERLQEAGFYVYPLGKEFFGEKAFRELGLTDTSTLYILKKQGMEKMVF